MSRQRPAVKIVVKPNDENVHGTYRSNDQGALPNTLRCVFCDQEKPLDAFSKTQALKAGVNPYAPHGYDKKSKYISCKKCTASQTVSLTCMVCTKTKPLEHFAKNQRRNAERARCLKCMKKREEEDIWDSDPDTDDSDDGHHRETWHDIL